MGRRTACLYEDFFHASWKERDRLPSEVVILVSKNLTLRQPPYL